MRSKGDDIKAHQSGGLEKRMMGGAGEGMRSTECHVLVTIVFPYNVSSLFCHGVISKFIFVIIGSKFSF